MFGIVQMQKQLILQLSFEHNSMKNALISIDLPLGSDEVNSDSLA